MKHATQDRAGHGPSRRDVLGAGLLGLTGASLPRIASGAVVRPARGSSHRHARNLIFMVADGMSTGTLTLAETFRAMRDARPGYWVGLWNRDGVHRASASTASADSYVTDSAAGASAWSTGQRTNNGVLNILPDGTELTPLLVRAAERGMGTGVVTTTRVTHATPAAFYATIRSRDLEDDIAGQLLDRGVHVALGGGSDHFPEALLSRHADARVIRSRAEVLDLATGAPANPSGRVLGLFTGSHMHYELDRPDDEPTLAEMTRAALAVLDRHPGGFVLQVEGGRVDHAAHANDAGALIREQLCFDDAIAEVLRYCDARDDTLVIITTDHGTANPGLSYYTRAASERFARIAGVTRSFEWLAAQLDAAGSPEQQSARLPNLIRQSQGISLRDRELELLERARRGERVHPLRIAGEPSHVLGALLADHLGVSFMSGDHTSDYVEVTALGPGSDALPKLIANTDLHALVCAALDLEPAGTPR